MLLPIGYAFGAQVQLPADLGEEGGVPLLGGEVAAAEFLQVEEGGTDTLFAEAGHGADAEGGLAHLAGVEDVAVFSRLEGSKEVVVGLALHVGGGIGAQRPACDIEVDCRSAHEPSPPQSASPRA